LVLKFSEEEKFKIPFFEIILSKARCKIMDENPDSELKRIKNKTPQTSSF